MNINEFLYPLIGEGNPGVFQMIFRAFSLYLIALLIVRLGDKRFLGKNTAFDMILGIIIGSVISRAINGDAGYFQTIFAAAFLVALHWVFAYVAFRNDNWGVLIKGRPRTLVKDGDVLEDEMKKSHVSRSDLESELRAEAKMEEVSSVKSARIEPSGKISVIKKDSPKILEIKVEEGVQIVRIMME